MIFVYYMYVYIIYIFNYNTRVGSLRLQEIFLKNNSELQ